MKQFLKNGFQKLFKRRLIYRLKGDSRVISLSFDDGPTVKHTETILAALLEENVKASFFVIGKKVEQNPEIVRLTAEQGHDVFPHGYTHRRARNIPTQTYVDGVVNTNNSISSITDKLNKRYFRPPYGDTTVSSFVRLLIAGFKYIMWSYDSRDSFVKSSAQLLEQIKKNPPSDGDILLFHDDYELTATALPSIIKYLKTQGFSFNKISDAV